jgi:hypothetical protein
VSQKFEIFDRSGVGKKCEFYDRSKVAKKFEILELAWAKILNFSTGPGWAKKLKFYCRVGHKIESGP